MDGENVTLLIAFAAGVLSFASPCCLPMVPVYIGHMVSISAETTGPSHRVVSLFHAAGNIWPELGQPLAHVPYVIVGYIQVALILGVARLLFEVPMVGSVVLLASRATRSEFQHYLDRG